MLKRPIADHISQIAAIDWNRRLFDSLIPLPQGTSYNSYLIEGTDKVALIDTVDPSHWENFEKVLDTISTIDYVIANHAEQDHSGCIPFVLEKYPNARLITNQKAKPMLMDLLFIDESRIDVITEEDQLDLGGEVLTFHMTPWVHWPETMSTFATQSKILFSCDFFGAHMASSALYAGTDHKVLIAAERYYAEIMMPYRTKISRNLEKVRALRPVKIGPSHGPVYDQPDFIMNAYDQWVNAEPANKAVIAYVSMHGSIEKMAEYLTSALMKRGVEVKLFDLTVTDLGELAIDLVDASTVVLGTPAVLNGVHPNAMYAAYIIGSIQPKAKYLSFLTSFSWGSKIQKDLDAVMGKLKAEVLSPVSSKGFPKEGEFEKLDELAQLIHQKHQ